MRSLDFWRVENDLIRENWVLIDLLHVYHQLGVDVLGRMRELTRPGLHWRDGARVGTVRRRHPRAVEGDDRDVRGERRLASVAEANGIAANASGQSTSPRAVPEPVRRGAHRSDDRTSDARGGGRVATITDENANVGPTTSEHGGERAPAFRAGKSARPDNARSLPRVLLENYGLAGAARLVATDVLTDLVRRTDTARPTSLDVALPDGNAGVDARARSDANRYVPSTYALLDAICARLSREMDPSDTGFVDVGSGKGKALIGAARTGWKSVRGVELSAALHGIAAANVRRLGLSDRVTCELGDAADLALAPHERVAYLFNPFTGTTLERCLDRIVAAGRIAPRHVVYVNPTEHAAFTKRFDLVEHGHIEPGRVEVAHFRTREPRTASG